MMTVALSLVCSRCGSYRAKRGWRIMKGEHDFGAEGGLAIAPAVFYRRYSGTTPPFENSNARQFKTF